MSVLELHVEGRHLVDSAGKIVRLPGVDAFALLKRAVVKDASPNGWEVLCKPVLQEWKDIAHQGGYDGPIILRVFRHAAYWNAFQLDPWSYSMAQVTELAGRCNDMGFYIDWSAGDYQVCFPSGGMGELNGPRGIREHRNQFCAALVGLPNNIWNVTNEPFKNGLNPNDAPPPPWAPKVQYSGKYYEGAWDHSTDLNCINNHVPRNSENGVPKWVTKGFESAPYLWVHGKPIFYDEDMGFDEVETGSRSNNPDYARILGEEISVVNAVYFHCSAGMSGDSLGPITRACAVNWFKGIAGGLVATR